MLQYLLILLVILGIQRENKLAENINNLNQEAYNVSDEDNPLDYNQMIHLASKRWNQTPESLEDIMNRIAFHETAQQMDPSIKQYGGGPGRGLFQFELGENQGGMTAMRRLRGMFKEGNIPEWTNYDPREGLDASTLNEEQQKMLFLANVMGHPTASLKGVNPDNLSEFWQNYHYAGTEDKRGLFNETMNAYDVKYKPTVDEIAY
tara:strand:+ start:131 stop:745 length:615 start_codon:yes stop_codon:yes gene_type:complete